MATFILSLSIIGSLVGIGVVLTKAFGRLAEEGVAPRMQKLAAKRRERRFFLEDFVRKLNGWDFKKNYGKIKNFIARYPLSYLKKLLGWTQRIIDKLFRLIVSKVRRIDFSKIREFFSKKWRQLIKKSSQVFLKKPKVLISKSSNQREKILTSTKDFFKRLKPKKEEKGIMTLEELESKEEFIDKNPIPKEAKPKKIKKQILPPVTIPLREENYYIELILHNPKNIEAYLDLGDLYFQKGNYKDAEASFSYVLKIDSGNRKARIRLEQLKKIQKKIIFNNLPEEKEEE